MENKCLSNISLSIYCVLRNAKFEESRIFIFTPLQEICIQKVCSKNIGISYLTVPYRQIINYIIVLYHQITGTSRKCYLQYTKI